MNTKALKQKILDLAIHGKLLPLDKVEKIRKEEPASILLEKIRAEKEEKIAKGELKKDKKDSFIFVGDDRRHYEKFADGSVKDIEDEIPFDIPDGWSWCRLGNCIQIKSGDCINVRNNQTGLYPIYGGNGITGYYPEYNTSKNSIIIGRVGFNCGSVHLTTDNAWITDNAFITSFNEKIFDLYFLKELLIYLNLRNYSNSTAQPVISGKTIYPIFIPLPPLAEQQLIVEEIEKNFAQIDLLEQNKTDLQTAIKQAKSKILDLAIHGKLVSQDPNDEPASILLEKIRAEKEEKIAKGELKKDKKDSFIFLGDDKRYYEKFADGSVKNIEDEIPFDIPNGWSWCRLGDVGDIITGSTPNKNKSIYYEGGDIPFYKPADLDDGRHVFKSFEYVTEEGCKEGRLIPRNSIAVCCIGTIGKSGFIEKEGITNQQINTIIPSDYIAPLFLYFFVNSSLFIESLQSLSSSVTISIVNKSKMSSCLLPLPPLLEQQRIVSKIEEIFAILDRISNELGADI